MFHRKMDRIRMGKMWILKLIEKQRQFETESYANQMARRSPIQGFSDHVDI